MALSGVRLDCEAVLPVGPMTGAELVSYLNDIDAILAILLAADLEKENCTDSELLYGQSVSLP